MEFHGDLQWLGNLQFSGLLLVGHGGDGGQNPGIFEEWKTKEHLTQYYEEKKVLLDAESDINSDIVVFILHWLLYGVMRKIMSSMGLILLTNL